MWLYQKDLPVAINLDFAKKIEITNEIESDDSASPVIEIHLADDINSDKIQLIRVFTNKNLNIAKVEAIEFAREKLNEIMSAISRGEKIYYI